MEVLLPFSVSIEGKTAFSEEEGVWRERQPLFSACEDHVGGRVQSRAQAQKTVFAVGVMWGEERQRRQHCGAEDDGKPMSKCLCQGVTCSRPQTYRK